MTPQDNFGLLRAILRALGLSPEAIDDIVSRILDFLAPRDRQAPAPPENPYFMRDKFLSPAEQSFYLALRAAADGWAVVCPKVGLGDIFYAKSSDPSVHRTATNRIDRKHVDFLLCDPTTIQPLLGVELDDSSHQRADRRQRDEFVESVFAAAGLPLVRLPVRHAYAVHQLRALLREPLHVDKPVATPPVAQVPPPVVAPQAPVHPTCPECNTPMVLRTATRGPNQGGKFWGCPNYPRCRSIVKYDPPAPLTPVLSYDQ